MAAKGFRECDTYRGPKLGMRSLEFEVWGFRLNITRGSIGMHMIGKGLGSLTCSGEAAHRAPILLLHVAVIGFRA